MRTSIHDEYIFQEIQEQAGIVRTRAAARPPAWPAPSGRTVITGAGDSLAAAELIETSFRSLDVSGLPAMAGSAAAATLGGADALIGISVSGRTPRVVEALGRARASGAATVAVTDDPTSPAAAAADTVWPIEASPADALGSTAYETEAARQYIGYHHDVAQTKSFLAVLTAIGRAADARAGASERQVDWGMAAAAVTALCSDPMRSALEQHAKGWAKAQTSFFLAGPTLMPLARFGSYKMFEFNHSAQATDIEEYCHTQYFITRPGDRIVFLIDDPASERRAAEVAPTLNDIFDARTVAIRSHAITPLWQPSAGEVTLPELGHAFERALAATVAVEWITYLAGRIGAPDINTFHAGYDAELLVGASLKTIRQSAVVIEPNS